MSPTLEFILIFSIVPMINQSIFYCWRTQILIVLHLKKEFLVILSLTVLKKRLKWRALLPSFALELNKDLHVCSTEPYIYSWTKIDSQNKLSEMNVSLNNLAMDTYNEVKSLHCYLECPNWPVIPSKYNSMKSCFLSSVSLNACVSKISISLNLT